MSSERERKKFRIVCSSVFRTRTLRMMLKKCLEKIKRTSTNFRKLIMLRKVRSSYHPLTSLHHQLLYVSHFDFVELINKQNFFSRPSFFIWLGHSENKKLVSIVGDICDPSSIEHAFDGVNCVFHCAAYINFQYPPNIDELDRVNVNGNLFYFIMLFFSLPLSRPC